MNDISKTIADIVADVKRAPVTEAEHERPLKELGIDSLDVANILLSVEERFNVKIPDAEVERLGTIAAIANYVETRASGA